MTDIHEYPLALYQGGELTAAAYIVNDAEEEKIANEQGFIRFSTAEGGTGGDQSLTATQLKEELTKLNVEFKGNASRDYLQGLYDEAIAKAKEGGTVGAGAA